MTKKPKEPNARITFCVSHKEKAEIEKEAEEQDLTVSRFIRGIIKIWSKYKESNGTK